METASDKLINNHHENPGQYDAKTLLSWSAPGRPFIKRGKQFYLTSLLIAILIEVILFLFSQYLFMFLVASLVFVGFAFATVPPKNFHYIISNQGIRIEDRFYLWQELYDFYFRRQNGRDILYIRTESFFPGALVIPLEDMHREHIRQVIIPYLPYREYVEPTFMDKSSEWLTKNFPLERTS